MTEFTVMIWKATSRERGMRRPVLASLVASARAPDEAPADIGFQDSLKIETAGVGIELIKLERVTGRMT
jgi:hypothetical protein